MLTGRRNKQFLWPPAKGYTLIEALIAVAITGILIVIIFEFIHQTFQMQTFISEQSQAISEAQDGIEIFTQELREVVPADTGAYGIVEAEENSLTFYSDIDSDVTTERVHYFLEEGNLIKGILEPSGDPLVYSGTETELILSSSIVNEASAPIFTYYDQNYPEASTALAYPADVTSVTLVQVNLQINVTPERMPDTYSLKTFVQLRNFKSNL